MRKNVKKEKELYEPMRKWLQEYLEDRYPDYKIITSDTSEINLDSALTKYHVCEYFPQAVGLDIQIDVLGIMKKQNDVKLAYIEAKKTQLNTHNLGQLLVYCRLVCPAEAFLLSSVGMGSLSKMLVNLKRTDILQYGDSNARMIHVAPWNVNENHPDMNQIVPSI
ncbi:hypothetical protein [Ligilactobacillus saerimneri]|uniref:hypothetical protein n=1 Tax=Ligilactobacillus saerimneri TaxID=228229 RepID=UPI003F2647E3